VVVVVVVVVVVLTACLTLGFMYRIASPIRRSFVLLFGPSTQDINTHAITIQLCSIHKPHCNDQVPFLVHPPPSFFPLRIDTMFYFIFLLLFYLMHEHIGKHGW